MQWSVAIGLISSIGLLAAPAHAAPAEKTVQCSAELAKASDLTAADRKWLDQNFCSQLDYPDVPRSTLEQRLDCVRTMEKNAIHPPLEHDGWFMCLEPSFLENPKTRDEIIACANGYLGAKVATKMEIYPTCLKRGEFFTNWREIVPCMQEVRKLVAAEPKLRDPGEPDLAGVLEQACVAEADRPHVRDIITCAASTYSVAPELHASATIKACMHEEVRRNVPEYAKCMKRVVAKAGPRSRGGYASYPCTVPELRPQVAEVLACFSQHRGYPRLADQKFDSTYLMFCSDTTVRANPSAFFGCMTKAMVDLGDKGPGSEDEVLTAARRCRPAAK